MLGLNTREGCLPPSAFTPEATEVVEAFLGRFSGAKEIVLGREQGGEPKEREYLLPDVVFRPILRGTLGAAMSARTELEDTPLELAATLHAALGQSVWDARETLTQEAQSFSRTKGLVGSLVLARQLIQDLLPAMTPIRIALERDPEIAGYETLLFHIAIDEPAERLIELDDQLQDLIFDHIPPKHRRYFLFRYGLE